MAYAGARFANSLLRGLNGEEVTECTFVKSDVVSGVEYFSTPVTLGVCQNVINFIYQKNGAEKIHGLGVLTPFEKKLLEEAVPELQKNIKKGVEFATKN